MPAPEVHNLIADLDGGAMAMPQHLELGNPQSTTITGA
jgi:hypothetical protein